MSQHHLGRGLIMAAFAIVLLSGLLEHRLRPREIGQLELAREIVKSGNWIAPQVAEVEGQRALMRPPLTNYLSALGLQFAGTKQSWAARAPSILTAGGVLLLTAWVGRLLGGARVGWTAAGVLLSCLNFFISVGTLRPDMNTTLLVVGALACFLGHSTGNGTRGLDFLGFCALGLILLNDGWAFVVLPVLGIAAWQFGQSGAGRTIRPMRWFSGALLTLSFPLIWLAIVRWKNGTLPVHWSSGNTLSLFANSDQDAYAVWALRMISFAWGTLPWTLLAVGSGLNWLCLRRAKWRLSPTSWMLAGWVLGGFLVLLTIGPSTFGSLITILPGFALWIAGGGNWRDSDRSVQNFGFGGIWCVWGRRVSLLLTLTVLVSPALAIAVASLTLPGFQRYGFSPWFGPALGVFACACCGATYFWAKHRAIPEADCWQAFEDAAGAAVATMGIAYWLLLGSQLDALSRLAAAT